MVNTHSVARGSMGADSGAMLTITTNTEMISYIGKDNNKTGLKYNLYLKPYKRNQKHIICSMLLDIIR